MNPRKRTLSAAAVVAAATLVLAGCGSSDSDSGSGSGGSGSSSKAAAKGDGTLTIGSLLPRPVTSRSSARRSSPACRPAIDDINAQGGVLGEDVVQVKADSG